MMLSPQVASGGLRGDAMYLLRLFLLGWFTVGMVTVGFLTGCVAGPPQRIKKAR
jgi:hypothetical protein